MDDAPHRDQLVVALMELCGRIAAIEVALGVRAPATPTCDALFAWLRTEPEPNMDDWPAPGNDCSDEAHP